MMQPSANGYAFVKKREGFRPTAYRDAGGVLTIGYGHTRNVVAGDTCTIAQGEAYLAEDGAVAAGCINRLVTISLTQNQFDALWSLTFNIGPEAFEGSTLLQKLNQRDFAMAATEFTRWNKSGGRRLAGLLDRRLAEQTLFNTP